MYWHRSSRSGSTGNCVELRQDFTAVRDSKQPGIALAVSQTAARALITQIRR
ncbi:DUF397 domain-containing protein [Actinokineospora sp. PR83]|uniref:DUF397 domain-containing protein n=1 Tax=Actinokineospora sp. PR83 TaxID=2884908 RepID=UPI001F43E853|nr:DUF397 domain-containing protein [Actinokineospora sp. PR83]MCG8915835.1 DUF397 domain-containing protein [Actinokineospora sp. PR83]